jgi:hypothetical protein
MAKSVAAGTQTSLIYGGLKLHTHGETTAACSSAVGWGKLDFIWFDQANRCICNAEVESWKSATSRGNSKGTVPTRTGVPICRGAFA